MQRLLDRLRALPGVSAAGAVNQLPLAGADYDGAFAFQGASDPGAVVDTSYRDFPYSASYRVATPGYLKAIGARLARGRLLTDRDRPGQPESAVVNQAFVRRYLPGTNPIGVRFKYRAWIPSIRYSRSSAWLPTSARSLSSVSACRRSTCAPIRRRREPGPR